MLTNAKMVVVVVVVMVVMIMYRISRPISRTGP
jgi:hypothetical protein